MSVGASLRQTFGQWFEAFGARDSRAIGDLIDTGAMVPRHSPPACDLCGRRLLLGEPLNRFRKDDGVVTVCPVCEPEALLIGYVRLPAEGDPARWYTADGQVVRRDRQAAEPAGIPLPGEAAEAGPPAEPARKRLKTAA